MSSRQFILMVSVLVFVIGFLPVFSFAQDKADFLNMEFSIQEDVLIKNIHDEEEKEKESCVECKADKHNNVQSVNKQNHSEHKKSIKNEEEQVESIYVLGVGDEIQVTVFGEQDLSGAFKVNEKGMISFPLIGEVAVAGLTPTKLEKTFEQKLSEGFLVNPSVSIQVSKQQPFYILGEIRSPGSYAYQSNMNVLKAVALAGGFTYRAVKDEVKILRAKVGETGVYKEFPVSTEIVPGDIILVEERFF